MIILLKKRFVYWHSDKSGKLKYAEIGRNKRFKSGKENSEMRIYFEKFGKSAEMRIFIDFLSILC